MATGFGGADLPALTGSLGAVLAESEAATRRLHGAIAEAVATAGPALTRLEFTRPPRRLSSAELGESVVVAVNRALEQIPPAVAPQGLGSAVLDARLRELQEASVRQMSALTGALTGVMQTIREPGR